MFTLVKQPFIYPKSGATVERYREIERDIQSWIKNKVGLDIDISDSMKVFVCPERNQTTIIFFLLF